MEKLAEDENKADVVIKPVNMCQPDIERIGDGEVSTVILTT